MEALSYENIPDELKRRDQWLLWGSDDPMAPRQPHWRGDYTISWSDPDDWHSFEEAVETASENEAWGIGYVMALDNDSHPRGLYGCIDVDGGLDEDGKPKAWLPGLDEFVEDGAYIEKSPSGTGLHIPFVGHQPPGWWTDSQMGDHEGVDVLTNKFCTFTGDTIGPSGSEVCERDPTSWLFDVYRAINGESPRLKPAPDSSTGAREYNGDEWLDQGDIREALSHVDADCEYPMWRDIGFAIHDFDDGSTGKSLFEQWSRGGSKWDRDAERYVDAIWQSASPGDGVTVGTLIHHAREGGWEMPRPSGGQKPAPDGGTATADTSDAGPEYQSIRERVEERVLIPVFPDKYGVDREKIKHDTAIDRFAKILDDEYSFLRPREDTHGWRDTLYVYEEDSGIYEPHGEYFIETEAERLLGDFANNQRVNEITGKIERRSRVKQERLRTDPERLVVGNGILNLHTGDINPHTPEEYHKTSIPVDYKPDAECPAIDDFFHDIVDDSDVPTLYRLVAHSIYREYAAEKSAMLLGEGQNGKSVFIDLLERFLGRYNVSNQSLQKLNSDDWSANNLVGRLANFHPDLSDQKVKTMQMFKKLTGRDTIDADVKFEKPVTFENYATLIFACNRMPVLEDDTRGNWRRWILIQFPNTFERDDEDFKEKRELMAELTQDSELEGLLARAVDEVQEWANGRRWFPKAPHWRETRRQIRRAAEPVYDFAMTCLRETDEDGFVAKDTARRCYRAYASIEGLPPLDREDFGNKLLNQTDANIASGQKRVNGQRRHVYKGVELSERGRQLLEDGDGSDGQASLQNSSTSGDPEFIVRFLNDASRHDTVSESELLNACREEGMDLDQAQNAIDKAARRGAICRTPSGDYYT